MRKFFIVFLGAILAMSAVFAQQNAVDFSFAFWCKQAYQGFSQQGEPLAWLSSNQLYSHPLISSFNTGFISQQFNEKGMDSNVFQIINYQGAAYPGFIFTGTYSDAANGRYGFPYKQRPVYLSGNYRFLPVDNDNAAIFIKLTKFDPITKRTILVGKGAHIIESIQNEYVKFDIPITYYSDELPDTAGVFIQNSTGEIANEGTALYIGNLGFEIIPFAAPQDIDAEFLKSVNDDQYQMADNMTIGYSLQDCGKVHVRLVDMEGNQQADYQLGFKSAGNYVMDLPLTGLQPGIYRFEMSSGTKNEIKKLVLMQ